ncbi:hypothetical protein [Bremerella cremea]|uniref:hypothetical protein n=1 Tax=Bremerella cremea TaxID=1031537 RepID=UPI0018F788AA|nr:hypothetical protein [Bremerella cremea]
MKQAVLIIGLAILASVAYGVIHDQITARLCVEYFTIGHMPILGGTENPALLGLAWGFLATWWVGVMLGIPLAFVCQTGSMVKKSAKDLLKPLMVLMFTSGCLAIGAGVVGYLLAANGQVRLMGKMAEKVPPEKHVAFLTDLWIHNASYTGGFLGGIVLMLWVVFDRYRRTHMQVPDRAPAG